MSGPSPRSLCRRLLECLTRNRGGVHQVHVENPAVCFPEVVQELRLASARAPEFGRDHIPAGQTIEFWFIEAFSLKGWER